MANLEVFQNGVWTKTQEPIFQIRRKEEDGSYTIVAAALMTEAEAKGRMQEMQPTPKQTPAKKKRVFKKK